MRVECFVDTNVLVYAASSSRADAPKRAQAIELIQRSDFGLSETLPSSLRPRYSKRRLSTLKT